MSQFVADATGDAAQYVVLAAHRPPPLAPLQVLAGDGFGVCDAGARAVHLI